MAVIFRGLIPSIFICLTVAGCGDINLGRPDAALGVVASTAADQQQGQSNVETPNDASTPGGNLPSEPAPPPVMPPEPVPPPVVPPEPVPPPVVPPEPVPPPVVQKVLEEVTIFANGNLEISQMNPADDISFMLVTGVVKKIRILVHDPDYLDEGRLLFNGQSPLQLWSATMLDAATLILNDNIDVAYEFTLTPAQSAALLVGQNTLSFEWIRTGGYAIKRIVLTIEKDAP